MRGTKGPAIVAGLFAALVATQGTASAQLRTCVQVEAPAAEREALTRLVRSELDRHPTHRAAMDACQGFLTVELLELGAQKERWVTGRINAQVPHREQIGPDGVAAAVERLLTVLLHNDPLALEGPRGGGWLERQGRALERRSVLHWGAELSQTGFSAGGQLVSLPGLALTLRREVSALFVGARLGGALDLGAARAQLRVSAALDAQLEAGLYARPAADVSLFASALVGLVHLRLSGPAPLDGPDATGSTTSTGLSLALRGGVEALRTSNTRVLAFLQLEAPAFASRDPDHGIVDQWLPSVSVGVGALF